MSLRALLAADDLPVSLFARRLNSVALWPAAPQLAARLTPQGDRPDDGLKPGETWLIAVHETRKRGSLWRLHARPEGHAAECVDTAREALERAVSRALRSLSVVPRLPLPQRFPRLRAELVRAEDGEVADHSVRGPSFGLAMVLAAGSRVLDRPIPSELLVTATVDDAGVVGRVDDLEEKIAFVIEYALGITRLMVHESQAEHARSLLSAAEREGRLHGREIVVDEIETAAEAVAAAFPGLEGGLRTRWSDAAEADRAARALLADLLRGDRHTNNWRGLVRAGELLALHVSAAALWRTVWIRFIASRHAGGSDVLIQWPEAEALGGQAPDERWLALSQVLQSAADHTDDDSVVLDYLDRSEGDVNVWAESCADGRRFLGARGRALAAVRRWDEAARTLDAAVAGWFRGDERELAEASRALSELLRIRGFVGDDEEVARALEWADRYLRHTTEAGEHGGEPWVRHARARCLALKGHHHEALALLQLEAQCGVEPAGRRWRARIQDAVGDRVAADETRATLVGDEMCWREAAALAALDRALARDGDHRAALRAFENLGDAGAELRRMLRQRGLTPATCDVAQAREIADRFRY